MMNGRIYENQRKTHLERFDTNPHSIRLIISWCVFQLQVMFVIIQSFPHSFFTNLRMTRNPRSATTIITTTISQDQKVTINSFRVVLFSHYSSCFPRLNIILYTYEDVFYSCFLFEYCFFHLVIYSSCYCNSNYFLCVFFCRFHEIQRSHFKHHAAAEIAESSFDQRANCLIFQWILSCSFCRM